MFIYCFSSSFKDEGCNARERAVVWRIPGCKKNIMLSANWSVGSSLCHLTKTTDGRHVGYRLTFQTKTKVLLHYEGILLVKLLWQIQNYQLVLVEERD